MKSEIKTFKFGGASVKDAKAIQNMATLLAGYCNENCVIVVSAMGKTTNELEKLVDLFFYRAAEKHKAVSLFESIKKFHFDILEQLFPDKNNPIYDLINNSFVEIEWILEDDPTEDYNREYDQIVSIGEIVSTQIIHAYLSATGLKSTWVDIRGLIQTDDTFREAKVDWELTQSLIDEELLPLFDGKKGEGAMVVTQGFIGSTSENFTSTLGREGSDYSAAILAHALNSESLTIWKDVAGVYNADPKWFDETQKIDQLSYQDAIELAYFGATVIHPKTIKPLQNKNIPLLVRSFLDPQQQGTLINQEQGALPVPCFIFKVDQLLLSISPLDFSFIVEENLSAIFKIFADRQIKMNLMQNTALNFSVCIDNDPKKIPELIAVLQKEFKVLFNEQLELITIRHYNQETIERVTNNKNILLEVKSRVTAQMVVASQA